MYYAFISEDIENNLSKRMAARCTHLQGLNNLADQDCLLLAGSHSAIDSADPADARFSSSLVIAAFDSLEQTQAGADADPYVTAGVYKKVTVKPFK